MTNITIHFDNGTEAQELQRWLELLDLEGEVLFRDLQLIIHAEETICERTRTFVEMLREARNSTPLDAQTVTYAYGVYLEGEQDIFSRLASHRIDVNARKPSIMPKTLGQQLYLDAMIRNPITFSIGPAGTGKTYLAMAMAVSALLKEEVSRIILTRPAIEAGETLGFLPGDMNQKVYPYLRPLYDALYNMLPPETVEKYNERGMLEIAPLAYMRGRTLNHAFVILDEAQNTTPQQMLMFLTRLGFDSRCAITGDLTQIDLPNPKQSGLLEARSILKEIPGIQFVDLSQRDVVRHPLVQKVIEAYQKKRSS